MLFSSMRIALFFPRPHGVTHENGRKQEEKEWNISGYKSGAVIFLILV